MTVLVTTRGDGLMMPAAIVYPYKRAVPKEIVSNVPDQFVVARSDSGWMNSEIFFEYMANCFIPTLNEMQRQEKQLAPSDELVLDGSDWIVYWIDGYASHLTLHVSKLCEMNRIWLYCFKAHASHLCQPNDVGPFKPLKEEWRNAVSEWRRTHPYRVLSRALFAPLLAKALEQLSKDAVVAGYRATGLCPWNVNSVHFERLTSQQQAVASTETSSPPVGDHMPTLALEAGPNTEGYMIAFRYDDMNNIIITHIIYKDDLSVNFNDLCANAAEMFASNNQSEQNITGRHS